MGARRKSLISKFSRELKQMSISNSELDTFRNDHVNNLIKNTIQVSERSFFHSVNVV